MRLDRLILAAAMMSLAACSKEEIPEVPKPNQEQTGKPEDKPEDKPGIDESICMKLSPTLQNMVEARSGVITQWQTGNRMGLFTEGTNLEYTFNGESWTATQPYEVKKEQTVYAYHPYVKGEFNNSSIKFDISAQEDVMYGQCTVNSDFTTAQPEMKHALSLVRIKVVRDEYLGEGVITDMAMDNVPRFINMNYTSGVSMPVQNSERISIPIGGGFMLDDEHPTIPEAILPTWGSNYGISLSFSLDGKRMEYVFPESHRWEMGMIYTYTIKIKGEYNAAVNREDVPIDVQYWSQFGKTDDIVLKEIDFGDFENIFSISTNHTQFGYDCYQNEGKPFGLFYSHYGVEQFDGRMRFVFMRPGTDEIVEKFQPIDIKVQGRWDGKKIQCYVTAAPGTYQLVPLFQRKGESTWFKADGYERGGTDEDWQYEVKAPAPDNLPSLRNILLEKEEKNSNFFSYDIPYNQPFNVVYTLSNKGKGALKGEIKAVWEREFKPKSNSYRLGTRREDAVNNTEWFDEIGTVKVDIQPGIRYWKGVVECKVTKFYSSPIGTNGVPYAGPVIHLYWRAEGTQEWKLLRLDADYLFNRDYTGPDIWDETLNYINVSLEDWYQ